MSTPKRKTKVIDGILYQECRYCNEWHVADVKNFTKNNRSPLGYSTLCRNCKKEMDKKYHSKIKADPVKWAAALKRSNQNKKANPNTQIGWTEYNSRPEVKARKAAWSQKHTVVKALTEEQYKLKIWRNAKHRASSQGIPFNIEIDDIIIPEKCPLLGTVLTRGEHTRWKHPEHTISLDKIIPELGYVKGNVRIISTLANTMKSNATKDQLLTFAKNIESYMNGEDIVQTTENLESVELEDKEPLS